MAELEEELIGDDLDYEYDLDEEEEEALLAGEVPSHEVDVEDIIEFKVDDDFGGEEDGGQISHSKTSVHNRLTSGPNRLHASGRLQPPNSVYEDEEISQIQSRLQPPNTVYEEVQDNRLQSSGRLQPSNAVYEEEEIQESYDSSINDEPVPVHIQIETQNIIEEEEEEEEEEDDGRGRDRFKSERCKTSLVNTTIKRVIPDSLDQVQVKDQLNQQRNQRGRGRGRGGQPPMQRGGMMRGGQRGGRGGMMPPYGWPGPRGGSPHWQQQQQQQPPLMMNPPNRMNFHGNNMPQGRGGGGGLPGMGRQNVYSLFGPGPPSQGQNVGNFSLMGNVPWSAGVGPYGGPGILSHLVPRPQIPPPDDMRNMIKKRSMNDPMTGAPNKQMKINQGPVNNQHQHQPQHQHQHPHQHQPQHQQQPQHQASPQHGGMAQKAPITSRLSMPSPNAKPTQTPSNVNPNLTTIKTVDINSIQQNQGRPHQNQGPPQQNQFQRPPQGQASQQNNIAKPQNVAAQPQAENKPPVNQNQQNQVKPAENKPLQSNQTVNQQNKGSTVQANQNDEAKPVVPEAPKVPLTPEEAEYQKKLEQQRKLREEMLAKKEARRKAAAQVKASEMAKKKVEEDKNKPPAPVQEKTIQQSAAPTPQAQPVQKEAPAVNKVQQNQQNNAQVQQQKPQIPPNQQQKQGFRKMPQQQNQGGPRPQANPPQPFRGGMGQQQNRGPPPSRYDDMPRPLHNVDQGYGHQPRPYYPPPQDRPSHHQGPPSQNMPPPHPQGPPPQHSMPPPHHPPPVAVQPPPHQSHGPPPHQGPPPHGPPPSHGHLVPGHQHPPNHHPMSDMHRMPPISPVQRPSHSILNAPRPSPSAILGPPPELPHRPLIDSRDSYPPSSDYYSSSRAPLSSHEYSSSQYSEPSRSSWSDYPQSQPPSQPPSYDSYRSESYSGTEREREEYYRRDSYQDQRYPEGYRYESYDREREYDERYRDSYYRDSYPYDQQYREGDYRYQQAESVPPSDRGMGMKQPVGGHVDQNPHHIQVKLVETPPKPTMTSVHTQVSQVGQKIQTIQRPPITNMRKTLYRRITRKNAKGEVISVKKIPVDEQGEQIGEPITEYLKSDHIQNLQTIPVVSHQHVQDHNPVVKTVRQIVKKVPMTHQHQQEQQQAQLRLMQQNKRQQMQQGHQPIKVVKRTIISPGEAMSPTKQTTRRVITTTSQAGATQSVMQQPFGRRRVITAAKSLNNTDLPTVQLCDLPTNIQLTDINKMVTGSGVEQPLKVSYVPGSGECYVSFRSAEIAARFYQKMNRRMVNMSVIKANMLC